MALLDRRSNERGIIEGRFIKSVLQDQGKEIYGDINKLKSRFSFSNAKWDKAGTTITDDTLTYSAVAAERFVDMKTRKVKGYTKANRKVPAGKIKKRIVFPIHNKVMWTHKKFIIKTLSLWLYQRSTRAISSIGKRRWIDIKKDYFNSLFFVYLYKKIIMDYTEKTVQLFKDLPFINIAELAKLINMDPKNFANHANGRRATSEKIYQKILISLEIAKSKMP